MYKKRDKFYQKYLRDKFLFKRITIIRLTIENLKMYKKRLSLLTYIMFTGSFDQIYCKSAWKWIIFVPEFDIYENWMPKFQLSVNVITLAFKSQNLGHFHIVDQLFSQMAMKFKVDP